ncbi:MAG: heme-binding protein [Crocinitomicaceae bacterium]|nr:heme-binding protein [Crocinitomicaceae bacterium]MDP4956094.1 heme-binding protein [Crocinitomicaceae bacterium]
MKKLLIALSVIGFLFILLLSVMRSSIETPDYEVLRVLSRKAEIRRYPDLILAQTQLDSNTYSVNSSLGFRRVAGYIFGANEQNEKIAMTSPVVMEMGSETQMSFVMPKQYSLDALPNPSSANVKIAKRAARTLAVLRFGGYTNDEKIEEKASELRLLLQKEGIEHAPQLIYMGYNAPWDFIGRRNEVAFEIVQPD